MKQHFKHLNVLLASLLLIFAFYLPVQAAEEKEPTIIPLAQGQTMSGSFSDNESSEVFYLITITQEQAITIYGTQTEGEYVSLSIYDQDMKHITHQSSVSSRANYSWRTEILTPGKYYIGVSSHYTAINYTVTYDPSPYPNAISLERTKKVSGKVTSANSKNTYKIVLTKPLTITFSCTKDKGPYLGLELFDEKGAYVDHMSMLKKDAAFSWTPDKKLSAGTYYLHVSRHMDDVNYKISWQVKGPSAVKNLRVSKKTTNMITLKWSKASGASKYIVYMYNTKNKTYKTYKTVTSTTCKVKKLKAGTKYTFKVVPVMKYGSEQIKGDAQKIKTATAPKKVNAPTVTYYKSGTLYGTPVNYYKVKWKKVTGATGYQVYVKAHGTDGWKKSGTVKSNSCMFYVVKGFSAQVKVRAYTSNDGVNSYGAFSKVKTIKSR